MRIAPTYNFIICNSVIFSRFFVSDNQNNKLRIHFYPVNSTMEIHELCISDRKDKGLIE